MSRFAIPVVFTSGVGLFAYLSVKFVLAVSLGVIVAPWQLFKRVKELSAVNTLNRQLAQGKI